MGHEGGPPPGFGEQSSDASSTGLPVGQRPGGVSYPPTAQWQPGRQVAAPLPIPLSAELPAGEYTLALGVYDAATGARQPLTMGAAADTLAAGPDAALLGRVTSSGALASR